MFSTKPVFGDTQTLAKKFVTPQIWRQDSLSAIHVKGDSALSPHALQKRLGHYNQILNAQYSGRDHFMSQCL